MESAFRMALDAANSGFKDRRKVSWVSQGVIEYWQKRNGVWTFVSSDDGDEWKPSEFDFMELRNPKQAKRKDGHYGWVIVE